MKVTAPQSFSHVTVFGRPVEQGEEVDVTDELGAQLIEQGWTTTTPTSDKTPKRAAAPAAGRLEPTATAAAESQTEEQQ